MEHKKTADAARVEQPLVVVFVRHAEAVSQGPEGVHKEDDPPLTPLGQRQSMRLARRLDRMKFNHVYVSPAVRAHETAQAVLRFHRATPTTVLKEIDEVSRDHFITVPPGFSPAGRDMLKREREAVERFVHRLQHSHKPGEQILVVSHGNFIRTAMPLLGGRSPIKSILMDISNTGVSILEMWRSGSAVLKLANCTKHLLPGEST